MTHRVLVVDDESDITELLRVLPSTRAIPILMLSAWATEQSRMTWLRLDASDYMTKPFSPRDVVTRVGDLLRNTEPGLLEEESACRVTEVRHCT